MKLINVGIKTTYVELGSLRINLVFTVRLWMSHSIGMKVQIKICIVEFH